MTPEPAKTHNRDHRQRLLAGLAESLSSKAYRDITLADIAAAARVSRRTFYEQFPHKDACLIALCEDTSEMMMGVVIKALSPDKPWHTLVRDITQAYLVTIQAKPVLMRALYIELAALGDPGLRARRAVAERFARFLQQQVEHQRQLGEPLYPLELTTALVVVTGINELILYALMDDKGGQLLELAPTAERLVFTLVGSPF